jgi:hypothetical protein
LTVADAGATLDDFLDESAMDVRIGRPESADKTGVTAAIYFLDNGKTRGVGGFFLRGRGIHADADLAGAKDASPVGREIVFGRETTVGAGLHGRLEGEQGTGGGASGDEQQGVVAVPGGLVEREGAILIRSDRFAGVGMVERDAGGLSVPGVDAVDHDAGGGFVPVAFCR